jgi:putative chitinase
MITSAQIQALMPAATKQSIDLYLPEWIIFLPKYEVTTPLRLRMYFSQIAHETGQLKRIEENLNYSAPQLMKTWPKRFSNLNIALKYARKPQAIANYVYANRGGNGPESSGDGWKNRGRGLIQTTFKNNYLAYSRAIYKDDRCVENPDLLLLPKDAVESSLFFWKNNGLNFHADREDLVKATRIINGGLNGFDDREKFYNRSKSIFI